MGNPKFPRKKYTTPLHPWKEERIKSERELLKKYGLKNHKEVWKAKTYLGKYRHQARELLAKMGAKDPQVKKESEQLLLSLTRLGILQAGSSLDDVLALETESVLSRRLQTLVYLKGLSSTPDHSRQLITHGHIAIGDRKVTIPSYMVIKDEENEIGYTGRSPLNELSHPARPKADFVKKGPAAILEEKPEQQKETVKPDKESVKKDTEKPVEKSEDTQKDNKIVEDKKIKQETEQTIEKPKEDEKEKPIEEKPKPNLDIKPEQSKEEKVKQEDKKDTNQPVEKPKDDIQDKEEVKKKTDDKEGGK